MSVAATANTNMSRAQEDAIYCAKWWSLIVFSTGILMIIVSAFVMDGTVSYCHNSWCSKYEYAEKRVVGVDVAGVGTYEPIIRFSGQATNCSFLMSGTTFFTPQEAISAGLSAYPLGTLVPLALNAQQGGGCVPTAIKLDAAWKKRFPGLVATFVGSVLCGMSVLVCVVAIAIQKSDCCNTDAHVYPPISVVPWTPHSPPSHPVPSAPPSVVTIEMSQPQQQQQQQKSTPLFALSQYAARPIRDAAIVRGDICPITNDRLTTATQIGVMPCGHCFNAEGLRGALSHAPNQCPSCRSPGLATFV